MIISDLTLSFITDKSVKKKWRMDSSKSLVLKGVFDLIQRKEEDLKRVHFHTAFWTGLVRSAFLFLLTCLVVAPIAVVFTMKSACESCGGSIYV